MEELLYLDLHTHILPGIDDGAKTLDDSEALARKFLEIGIHRVVASSHIMTGLYPNNRDILLPLVASTQAHLDSLGLDFTIVPGSEVRLDLESCLPTTWLTINDAGKHLLVELPPGLPLVASLEHMLFELQARGITPIIAHPERQACLQKDPDILERWIDRGMLAQGTLCPLAGSAGEKAIEALETFLRRGLIAFMGSDGHQVDRRLRDLDTAIERLEELVGPANARIIRHDNPKALLDGTPIQRPGISVAPPPAGLFQRIMTTLRRA